jgi:UMF1 family MFS transporter
MRRRIWGWMMFDWASQPYNTLLLTFIFAPYFTNVVVGDDAVGQTLWATMLAVSGVLIAVMAPVLGAVADTSGRRLPWIVAFSAFYVTGAFALWWAVPTGESHVWILVAFGLGLVGLEFATIFTNAMLPDLGTREDLGRISGSGWAWGYVGGVLALFLMLLFFAENEAGRTFLGTAPALGLDPETREGTRFVGPFTALWYAVFIVPFFLWVREPRSRRRPAISRGLADLWQTLRRLPQRHSLSAYLASSMFYRDALNGLYTFGGIYAAGVLGWSIVEIGVFGIIAAISGAVFSWIGGHADSAFGPKPVITVCIGILLGASVTLVGMTPQSLFGVALPAGFADGTFYFCGIVIGAAGGAVQAASRTMLVRQANVARMTEAFGLYALAGKATSFVAPAFIALSTELTGSQRAGIAPIIVLFLIGLVLLVWVKPDGERAETWSAAPSPSS